MARSTCDEINFDELLRRLSHEELFELAAYVVPEVLPSNLSSLGSLAPTADLKQPTTCERTRGAASGAISPVTAPAATMVALEDVAMDELILRTFEQHEDDFCFPIRSQKDAKAFVRSLNVRGMPYLALSQEIEEFEHNLTSWRKGLGRVGIGQRVIERINRPLQSLLDEEDDVSGIVPAHLITRTPLTSARGGSTGSGESSSANRTSMTDNDSLSGESNSGEGIASRTSSHEVLTSPDPAVPGCPLRAGSPPSHTLSRSPRTTANGSDSGRNSVESNEKCSDSSDAESEKGSNKENAASEHPSPVNSPTRESPLREGVQVRGQNAEEKPADTKSGSDNSESDDKPYTQKSISERIRDLRNGINGNDEKKENTGHTPKSRTPSNERISTPRKLSEEQDHQEHTTLSEEKTFVSAVSSEKECKSPVKSGVNTNLEDVCKRIEPQTVDENYNSDLDPENPDTSPVMAKLIQKIAATRGTKNSAGFIFILTDSAPDTSTTDPPRIRAKLSASRYPEKRLAQARCFNPQMSLLARAAVARRQAALAYMTSALETYACHARSGWFEAPCDALLEALQATQEKFPMTALPRAGDSHC